MDRGFFRADQDWTCYRRNYFQVSATFEVHGLNYLINGPEVPCLLRTENGEIHQVDFFSIGVSARVTGSDKRIELVQHTPKRDKGPQMIPEPRVVSAGGNLHLASVGSNHNIVTFERMQFKTATANNGKRRAAQQYYEIVIDLCANSSSGKQFKVASCTSAPLVVRGRSPGHYADSHTRYRSLDAGTPSSFPGQGGPPSAPSSANTHPGAPSSSSNGEEGHHYMPPQPQPRFPGVNPSSSGGNDYGNSYSPYGQSPSGYPYQVGGYAPVLSTPPIGSTRTEEESGTNNREGGYMMPYSSHPHQQAGEPAGYYSNNNNNNSSTSSSGGGSHTQETHNSNSNQHHGYHTDNKPYWSGGNREQQQHGPGRYSNGSPYVNSEFNNGYSMRPQSQTNENTTSETNPLDAGRSITPDNKHFMQHHPSAH